MSVAGLLAGTARASVVTQQVSLARFTVFSNKLANSANVALPLTTTFNQFNANLGTLTEVSFAYDYEFSSSISVSNGSGGGAAAVSGPFKINGVVVTQNGFSVGDGSAGPSGFFVRNTLLLTDNLLSDFVGTGNFSFLFDANAGVSGGGSPGSVVSGNLALLSNSSVTVSYTYGPAAVNGVPEPSSLALVGASGLALWLLHRRRNARVAPPATPSLR